MYGIFTYIWFIIMVNASIYIYISYMDPMRSSLIYSLKSQFLQKELRTIAFQVIV